MAEIHIDFLELEEERMAETHIHSLPKEILRLIFNELDDASIERCSAVCSKWRKIINSPDEFWKHRYESTYGIVGTRTLPAPPTLNQWKEALLYNKNPMQYLSNHQTVVKEKIHNHYLQMFILYVFILPMLFTHIEMSLWMKTAMTILPFVMTLLTWNKISKLTAFPNGPLSYMFDKKTLQTNIRRSLTNRLLNCFCTCAVIPFWSSLMSLVYLVLDTILVCMSLFSLNLVGQWNVMKRYQGLGITQYKSLFVFVSDMNPVAFLLGAQLPSEISSDYSEPANNWDILTASQTQKKML